MILKPLLFILEYKGHKKNIVDVKYYITFNYHPYFHDKDFNDQERSLLSIILLL